MASDRKKSKAFRSDSTSAQEQPPGIAALFLIRFDNRAGYAKTPFEQPSVVAFGSPEHHTDYIGIQSHGNDQSLAARRDNSIYKQAESLTIA